MIQKWHEGWKGLYFSEDKRIFLVFFFFNAIDYMIELMDQKRLREVLDLSDEI